MNSAPNPDGATEAGRVAEMDDGTIGSGEAVRHAPVAAAEPDPDASGSMSIGMVSRLTGVPVETLRTWERRYGYPNPVRMPSGHRLYAAKTVDRIRDIARAIELGHRASVAVRGDADFLRRLVGDSRSLLDTSVRQAPDLPASDLPASDLPAPDLPVPFEAVPAADAGELASCLPLANGLLIEWLRAVSRMDDRLLDQAFRMEWAQLGTVRFISERAGPLMQGVGEAWRRGLLTVYQEHFASERLMDFLSGLWRPLSDRASGPIALCATLPGELHSLGLHMASCIVALAGFRIRFMGDAAPITEIAEAAERVGARCILTSVAQSMPRPDAQAHLADLRARTAPHIAIVHGGSGSPAPLEGPTLGQSTTRIVSLDALADYLRNAAQDQANALA